MIYTYLKILLLYFLINSCENNTIANNKKVTVNLNQTFAKNVILQSDLLIVGCGNIFYAYGFRFTLENSDSSIVGIIRCPDGYGENFFVKGARYNVDLTNNHIKDSLKHYSLTNPYEKYNLPIYLITEIKKE